MFEGRYISMERVICVRTCEACGRLACVSLVGHYFRILNVSFPKLRVFLKNHTVQLQRFMKYTSYLRAGVKAELWETFFKNLFF